MPASSDATYLVRWFSKHLTYADAAARRASSCLTENGRSVAELLSFQACQKLSDSVYAAAVFRLDHHQGSQHITRFVHQRTSSALAASNMGIYTRRGMMYSTPRPTSLKTTYTGFRLMSSGLLFTTTTWVVASCPGLQPR